MVSVALDCLDPLCVPSLGLMVRVPVVVLKMPPPRPEPPAPPLPPLPPKPLPPKPPTPPLPPLPP